MRGNELVPRNHDPKGANSGRPPTDDTRIAHGMLFAERIEGRDTEEIIKSAVKLLDERRRAAAAEKGKRHQPMSPDSARRRVRDVCAAVLRAHGPIAGLPTNLRTAATMLADIARRDGLAAGCDALVEVFAWVLAGGPHNRSALHGDPALLAECRVLVRAWVVEAMATISPGEIPDP